jgi:hypothetical protein
MGMGVDMEELVSPRRNQPSSSPWRSPSSVSRFSAASGGGGTPRQQREVPSWANHGQEHREKKITEPLTAGEAGSLRRALSPSPYHVHHPDTTRTHLHFASCSTMWRENLEEMQGTIEALAGVSTEVLAEMSGRDVPASGFASVDPDDLRRGAAASSAAPGTGGRRRGSTAPPELRVCRYHLIIIDGSVEKADPGKTNHWARTAMAIVEEAFGMTDPPIEFAHWFGRAVVYTDARDGTEVHILLKDTFRRVHNKKRWSQILYAWYLACELGFSLDVAYRNCYLILLTDGDTRFRPEAVAMLYHALSRDSRYSICCGRIFAVGVGAIAGFQKFEYAAAHWFGKVGEFVLGTALCAPGCFSMTPFALFAPFCLSVDEMVSIYTSRDIPFVGGSAGRPGSNPHNRHDGSWSAASSATPSRWSFSPSSRVMDASGGQQGIPWTPRLHAHFTAALRLETGRLTGNRQGQYGSKTDVREAKDFLVKDQGEDRYACTLMIQAGHCIGYASSSHSFTHCPTTFNEFFQQRRRWVTSTLVNSIDLIATAPDTARVNRSLWIFPFFAFITVSTVSGLLAPTTTKLVLIAGLNFGLGMPKWAAILLGFVVPTLYGLSLPFLKQVQQRRLASILGVAYAILASGIAVGVARQVAEDPVHPAPLYFIAISLAHIFAALIHGDISTLPYGIIFLLMIPTAFVFLMDYAVCFEGGKKMVPWFVPPVIITDFLKIYIYMIVFFHSTGMPTIPAGARARKAAREMSARISMCATCGSG